MTRRPLHFAFADVVPYAIVVVRSDEGARFLVNVRPPVDAGANGDTDAVTSEPRPVIGDRVVLDVDAFGVPFSRSR